MSGRANRSVYQQRTNTSADAIIQHINEVFRITPKRAAWLSLWILGVCLCLFARSPFDPPPEERKAYYDLIEKAHNLDQEQRSIFEEQLFVVYSELRSTKVRMDIIYPIINKREKKRVCSFRQIDENFQSCRCC